MYRTRVFFSFRERATVAITGRAVEYKQPPRSSAPWASSERTSASAHPKSAPDQQFWRQTQLNGTAPATMTRSFGGAWSPDALQCRSGDTISRHHRSTSNSRAAEDVRNGGLQQRFWAASMVLTTALPARPVGRLEVSEYSFISHADICRSFKPCSQVKVRSRSSGMASNSSQSPCQYYKEARLR